MNLIDLIALTYPWTNQWRDIIGKGKGKWLIAHETDIRRASEAAWDFANKFHRI